MNKQVYSNIVGKGKKAQVRHMFNSIAHRYDLLDHILSLNIDKRWRNKAIKMLKPYQPRQVLDIATGTADLAITGARILKPEKISGIDIAEEMLAQGRIKVKQAQLSDIITLTEGDAEKIPFESNLFDAVTVAFGVRNFEDLDMGLKEIYRVLKPKGKLLVLEFSLPGNRLVRWVYHFYFHKLVPFIGGLLTGSQTAYRYLPGSVDQFPYGKIFINILENNGFKEVICRKFSFGICSAYLAIK